MYGNKQLNDTLDLHVDITYTDKLKMYSTSKFWVSKQPSIFNWSGLSATILKSQLEIEISLPIIIFV